MKQGGKKELPPFDKFVHFFVEQLEPLMANLPEIDLPKDSDDVDYYIQFECKVTPHTYERDLYVTPHGEDSKKHHLELIAEGFFTQEAFEAAATAIEQEARKLPEYKENNYFEFPLR